MIREPERFPLALSLAIYVAFAALVYWVQGAEPPLSIDHIPYFKLADEIRDELVRGDYWRSFNSVRAYGVILAYLYDLTGSHLVSLKLLLAAMTVAYLATFQLFMSLATASRARATLFSLLSALFVTFGASIWGMTDFAASLNRTLIIPLVVVLTWFFFRAFATPWRYGVFPALILVSLLHLSALHVFLVFCCFEALDFAVRRRFRPDRNLAFFAAALVSSVVLQGIVEKASGGTTGYVRYTLNMAVPSLAEIIAPPPPAGPRQKELFPEGAAKPEPKGPAQPGWVPPVPRPGKKDKLTNQEAWEIELQAFPWRNLPPSLATAVTIASSFGVIFLLALAGGIAARRLGAWKPLDRDMATFAAAAVAAAYGLQTVLWILRNTSIPVFPINFEEIRAINMVMFPAVYFVFRLYDLAPERAWLTQKTFRAAVVVAFALQPIVLVKALPASWREGIIDQAIALGVLKTSDAPRMLYARQFLGLAGDGRRFYYSTRQALTWLEANAGPNDLVLTNLNEFYLSRVKTVGPFLGIVSLDVWDIRRARWADSLEAIDQALATRDLDQVLALARRLGATYAVVDWPVADAAYHDDLYSIVSVPRQRAARVP